MQVPGPQALIIAWLLLPFLAAFLSALVPLVSRWVALVCFMATAGMAAVLHLGTVPDSLLLLGSLGVQLQLDGFAAPFLLLDSLVCSAILLDSWHRPKPGPFLLLLMVAHGAVASTVLVADLISLYVSLELAGISAFLLILMPRTGRSLWVALRYLLIGNTVMTLYLIGVAVLYQQEGSFRLDAVTTAGSGGVVALLMAGLLTKSGLFLSGSWLPLTQSEAPEEVSALLSGVLEAAAVAPVLQLGAAIPALGGPLTWIGLASALFGIVFALWDHNAKRLLAWSTVSQMGLVVLVPLLGGVYVLAHGLAKAALFLVARRLPGHDLAGWSGRGLPAPSWFPLMVASLSIVGIPPLLGSAAKNAIDKALPHPMAIALSLITVGTVAVYARLWQAPLLLGEGGTQRPCPPVRRLSRGRQGFCCCLPPWPCSGSPR